MPNIHKMLRLREFSNIDSNWLVASHQPTTSPVTKALLTTKACNKDSWWSKPLDASCSSIAVSRTRSRQPFHLPLVDDMASTLTASARPSLVSIDRLDLLRTSWHGNAFCISSQQLPVEPVKREIDIFCVNQKYLNKSVVSGIWDALTSRGPSQYKMSFYQ